jgi:hypothetical protein
MQALSWAGDDVFLLDQWRAQADIKEAVRALRIGVTNCRPSAVLIECSGYGPTLAYDLRKRFRLLDVHLVPTDGRSKTRRLLDHIDIAVIGSLPSFSASRSWGISSSDKSRI